MKSNNMIDYKTLLEKYINHVGYMEGTDFISNGYKDTDRFTEKEWNTLVEISTKQYQEELDKIKNKYE